jgi:helicase
MDFVDRTFFAHQMDVWTIEGMIDGMLAFLEEEQLISQEGEGFRATMFGRRTSALYIDPLSAVLLKDAVDRAEQIESNPLCLLHACCSTPDMPLLYIRKKDQEWAEELAAANWGKFLVEPPSPATEEFGYFLAALKTASMLEHWMDEVPENDIAEQFGIGPGDIRNRVDNGEWLLYSMRELARLFASPVVGQLNSLVMRVRYGIAGELLPLVSLRGIGRKRARLLFDAGFKTLDDMATASVKELASLPGIGKQLAASISEQAGASP